VFLNPNPIDAEQTDWLSLCLRRKKEDQSFIVFFSFQYSIFPSSVKFREENFHDKNVDPKRILRS
jgi:hypothetical protein